MNTKVYDKKYAATATDAEAYADLLAIVRQLRRDCPWDREQTHESVRHLLIEESYEVLDCIDRRDWDGLKKELGDLLLHVLFHTTIAEQAGRFGPADVAEAESAKLIRRHPHVFDDLEVDGTDEVLANWEAIKMTEAGRTSAIDGVPRHLPALLRAHRTQEKAAGVGFDFPSATDAWKKVEEELTEFHQCTEKQNPEKAAGELGDLLFSIVNYARLSDLNAEMVLTATTDKFARRFHHVESRVSASDKSWAEHTLEEMDVYWEEAKRTD